jgi:voltage-gated potassium channel
MHPIRRILPSMTLLGLIALVGVAGYVLIEGWSLLESVYMVVITLFTIGFEEVHRLSPVGRILTIGLIVTGVGTAVYAAGQAVEIIVQGEILGYRRKKRMARQVSAMSSHLVVCGFGRVGHQVAEALDAAKAEYVVIDAKPETAVELETRNVPNIIGDATSDDILMGAGIQRARGLIACSDSDVANVYVTLSARALNPRLYIVARAGLPDTEKKLLMAGANRVISPYLIAGRRMAALATLPVASDFLDMVTHGGQVEFSLFEIPIPQDSRLVDQSLASADIRGTSGALVLAIRKVDGSFDLQARSSSVIGAGDILIVLGTPEQIRRLETMVH